MRWLITLVAVISIAGGASAQDHSYSTHPSDFHSAAYLKEQVAKLLTEAKASPSEFANLSMERYPGHRMNVIVRVKNGSAELHGKYSDIYVALDGEAAILIGGTMENRVEMADGEARGTRVIGGTRQELRPGDVIHIAPGVPHQVLIGPGKSFSYIMVKAEVPSK